MPYPAHKIHLRLFTKSDQPISFEVFPAPTSTKCPMNWGIPILQGLMSLRDGLIPESPCRLLLLAFWQQRTRRNPVLLCRHDQNCPLPANWKSWSCLLQPAAQCKKENMASLEHHHHYHHPSWRNHQVCAGGLATARISLILKSAMISYRWSNSTQDNSLHHFSPSRPNLRTISIREFKDGGREEGSNESVLEDSDERSASRWCCKVDWFVHTSMPREEWVGLFPLQVQRRKRTILHTSRTAGMRMMISSHFLLMVECLLPALMSAAQSTKFCT